MVEQEELEEVATSETEEDNPKKRKVHLVDKKGFILTILNGDQALTKAGYTEVVEYGVVYGRMTTIRVSVNKCLKFKLWVGAGASNAKSAQFETWLVVGTDNIKEAVKRLRQGYTCVIRGIRRTVAVEDTVTGFVRYNQVNVAKQIDILSRCREVVFNSVEEIKLYDRELR